MEVSSRMMMSSSRGLPLLWMKPPFSMSYPRRRWMVFPSWPVISCIRAAARPESAVWAKELPRRTFRTPATTVLLPHPPRPVTIAILLEHTFLIASLCSSVYSIPSASSASLIATSMFRPIGSIGASASRLISFAISSSRFHTLVKANSWRSSLHQSVSRTSCRWKSALLITSWSPSFKSSSLMQLLIVWFAGMIELPSSARAARKCIT